MAEPMSSNEIEDVLSSIRRLVAQDLKPADRAKLVEVAQATQKLVLAPELRVEDQAAKFATVRRPSRRAAFPPVDAVLAGVAALVGKGNGTQDFAQRQSAPQDFAPQDFSLGAQALADEAAAREAQSLVLSEIMRESAADLPPPSAVQDIWPSTVTVEAAGDMTAAERRIYGEDDTPFAEDEYSTFTIAPDALLFDAAPEYAAQNAQDVTEPPESEWEDAGPEEDAESDPSAEQGGHSISGTIEPDAAWADAAERRVIAELAGEAIEEEVFEQARAAFREPKFSNASSNSETEVLFDEALLRTMVQTIFREEMAGQLGERMTRNIRKLVRAEVGRMLAAQELE